MVYGFEFAIVLTLDKAYLHIFAMWPARSEVLRCYMKCRPRLHAMRSICQTLLHHCLELLSLEIDWNFTALLFYSLFGLLAGNICGIACAANTQSCRVVKSGAGVLGPLQRLHSGSLEGFLRSLQGSGADGTLAAANAIETHEAKLCVNFSWYTK